MRKLLSVSIVGVIILTLIVGLFGGVVEEGKGEIFYDSSTNTIYLNGTTYYLNDIYTNPSVPDTVFWHYPPENSYHTTANIQINDSAELIITLTQKLKLYNDSDLLYITVRGKLYANGNNQLSIIKFDSNSTSPSAGDWGGIRFITEVSSDSVLNFIYIANATKAIYCEKSNLTITNSIITNNSENGIYIKNSSPTLIKNKILNSGSGFPGLGGLYCENSKLSVENCTLLNSPYNDFILVGNANITTLNSTFDNVNLNPPSSQITVKWYLHVKVTEEDGVTPVSLADVYINDSAGAPIENSPFTTDGTGRIRWVKVIQYIDKASSPPVLYTPHNITVTHNEYYSKYVIKTIDSSKEIQINLTMIRRDLTTTPDDITFLPLGIPVAGEDLTVYVTIYNVEIDDAQNVRVKIFDNTTGGAVELYHIIIPEIKGNGSYEISKKWKPIPGAHIIEVFIDPNGEINEINSTMPPGWAENNNYASKNISVNARPLVNVTEPNEGTEINGSVFIIGTAHDDHADDIMILNEISRVDIRLEGYDWVELSAGSLNLTYNPILDIWQWHYGWDSTQWNGTTLADGNYTINARAWDNYHFSHIYKVNITINNTGANTPPNAIISSPQEPNAFNVSDMITFDGSDSNDAQTSAEDLIYAWDFYDKIDSNGDGNYTNDEDAFGNITTHAYKNKGFFNVTLTVTDEGGLYDTDTITIWIWNYRPVAKLNASNTTVYENDTVTFDASNSYDPDGIITSYLWNFDDGTIILTTWPIVSLNHSFNESRVFNVTLTVTDNNLTYNTTWILINVLANAAPTADISQPLNGQFFDVNETILFNGNSSSDPNDENLEYYWDFDDGTTYLENESYYPDGEYDGKTTHYYSELGPFPTYSYIIILEVRDDEGLSDTDTVTIIVQNNPPVAIARSNTTSAPTKENINFDGTDSYDPPPTPTVITYRWNFGEGNISTQANTTHQFAEDGIYNVTLTVTDTMGANDTDWVIITIINRKPIIEEVTVTPESPKMNEEITFTVTAFDDDGEVVRYSWDFGDSTTYSENKTFAPDNAFDGKTNHSYSQKDTYNVMITVEDDDGELTEMELTITVVNSPPEVNITYPENGAIISGTITIQGTSSDIDGSVDKVEVRIDGGVWILVDDESGDWSSWSLSWDTEDGVTNGQHTIYARANDLESNTDPPASITVTVQNTPTSISLTANLNPGTSVAGGSVEVYGYVTYNTGEGVLGAEVNITIQNEAGYWPTNTDSNGFYTTDITAPSESGSHTVIVKARKDPYTPVQVLKTLTVTAMPDLAISAADIDFNPSAPYAGDTVQITITVRNLGDVNANNVLVNAYDGDPSAGGDQIEPKGSDTVNVQKLSGANVILSWDTTGESGEHFIYILIDPNNSIEESNENNNKASRAISIRGKPDFAIDSADISFSNSNPREGDTISIRVKIYNNGDASDTVKYEVYDGDPDDEGKLIDSDQISIPGDNNKLVTVEWTIEDSGDHDIYVLLDPDDDIDETDETNNKAYNTISVESPPGEGGVPSWFIGVTVVIVVIVFILIYFLRFRERGPKEEKELPMAKVVQKDVKGTEKAKDEEEEAKSLLDSHGGVRI